LAACVFLASPFRFQFPEEKNFLFLLDIFQMEGLMNKIHKPYSNVCFILSNRIFLGRGRKGSRSDKKHDKYHKQPNEEGEK
jgi:hypothetical protein